MSKVIEVGFTIVLFCGIVVFLFAVAILNTTPYDRDQVGKTVYEERLICPPSVERDEVFSSFMKTCLMSDLSGEQCTAKFQQSVCKQELKVRFIKNPNYGILVDTYDCNATPGLCNRVKNKFEEME